MSEGSIAVHPVSASPDVAPKSDTPIFLFGFERSGTTLLSMMAGAHPQLAVPLTVTGMWYRYARNLDRYGDVADGAIARRLTSDLLAEERIRLWDVDLDQTQVLDGWQPTGFADVVARFHTLYAQAHGKPRWGNIDIATLDDMDIANAWFPNARFVHIVRDGRDVALSHETMPYGASNVLECAESWDRRLRTNLKMGAIIGPERYHVVRYEDLVLRAEETLERLCTFLGLPYSDDMLRYPEMADGKIPDHRRWLWPAIDKAPDRSKVFGWRSRMGQRKRLVFERTASALLRKLGYETLERTPKSAWVLLYEAWCLLGRGGRFRRIKSRLGLSNKSTLERQWNATAGRSSASNEKVQVEAFSSLVRDGTYSIDFEHKQPSQRFFAETFERALSMLDGDGPIALLDCGCGPGAWLSKASKLHAQRERERGQLDLYGFDITSEMVDVARERLSDKTAPENLQTGDILEDRSYRFPGHDRGFEIVLAYDVVQQLPPRSQLSACQMMLRHVAPGGVAIVFDQDSHSRFGRVMSFKKFVTQYLGIELVPRYYCNARYPPLAKFASELGAMPGISCQISIDDNERKRALLIHRAS